MCGIAGYFGKDKKSESAVCRALERMKRRGPDNSGYVGFLTSAGKHVYLLHTRLSIIDLHKRSDQPFYEGQKSMVFNGAIYNYMEIRKNLEKDGVLFRTESDTEVLIRSLEKKGLNALDDCEGMWAFACYDKAEETLLLCRDRFGEKPLYLYQDKSGIYFASEPKAIFALLGSSLPVNYDHLRRYMINGYKSLYKTEETFFLGLKEVLPGTICKIGPDGSFESMRYWNPAFTAMGNMSFGEAVEGARACVLRSVKLRLRSDVPIAFCMSGGVDSNALICTAKRKFNHEAHGFTVWNEDKRYEENEYVEAVIKELGIKHTRIHISPDNFLEGIRELINYHDAPVYVISYYLHWLLMKEVSGQGYRVSISGAGADEMFSGYYDHNLWYLAEIYDSNRELYETSKKNWLEKIKPHVRNPLLQGADRFVKNPDFREHIYLRSQEFAGTFLKEEWYEPFTEQKYTEDKLRNRMLNELFHEAVPVILHEDDLNAMFFSVENRSPFLDRQLMEFAYQIPTNLLIRDGFPKAVLREAMRGIVPDKILDNPRKVGFNAPVTELLDLSNPAIRDYLLDEGPIYDFVKKEQIAKLIEKKTLPNSESKFLFYFLNSKIFLE